MMPMHEFTAILDREPTDLEIDALFEAGLDDASPVVGRGCGKLMVSRRAESLSAAIVSVVEDAERAGFKVVGLEGEDLLRLVTA
jgi:hypothetical protein